MNGQNNTSMVCYSCPPFKSSDASSSCKCHMTRSMTYGFQVTGKRHAAACSTSEARQRETQASNGRPHLGEHGVHPPHDSASHDARRLSQRRHVALHGRQHIAAPSLELLLRLCHLLLKRALCLISFSLPLVPASSQQEGCPQAFCGFLRHLGSEQAAQVEADECCSALLCSWPTREVESHRIHRGGKPDDLRCLSCRAKGSIWSA